MPHRWRHAVSSAEFAVEGGWSSGKGQAGDGSGFSLRKGNSNMIPGLVFLEEALKEIVVTDVQHSCFHRAAELRSHGVEFHLVTRGDRHGGSRVHGRCCGRKTNPGSTAHHENALLTERVHDYLPPSWPPLISSHRSDRYPAFALTGPFFSFKSLPQWFA